MSDVGEAIHYFEVSGETKDRQDSLCALYEYIMQNFNMRFEMCDEDAQGVSEWIWETIARVLLLAQDKQTP